MVVSAGSLGGLVVACWSPGALEGRGCPGRRGLDIYAGMEMRMH